VNRLTTAYATEEKGTGGFSATGHPAGELLFRRARRHSRRVRLLRVTIPLVLALGLGAITLVIWFNPLRLLSDLPGSVGSVVISGSKMTMTQPKLSGYTRDERRYELTARAAEQDITKPDIIDLQDLRASLEMLDRSTVDMTAAVGVFDRKANVLTLERDILLTSTGGYQARLSQAVIDVRNGNIVSEQPIEVKMPQGKINANRLEIIKSGEIIRFDGGVAMTLLPDNAARDDTRIAPR
jgi:lipopolysaccharide export system protein LptC